MSHGGFYKLTYSNYDKETGVSIVQISSPYGSFVGQAHLHPDDVRFGSAYSGQNLAENRALIKYFEHRIKLVNRDIRTTNQIYSEIKNKTDKKVKYTDTIHLAYSAILDYRNRLEKQKADFKENIAKLEKVNEALKNVPNRAKEILRTNKILAKIS